MTLELVRAMGRWGPGRIAASLEPERAAMVVQRGPEDLLQMQLFPEGLAAPSL